MMTKAKCPNCGEILIEQDIFDTNSEETKYYEFAVGHCPNCHKDFQWTYVFELTHVIDIQEIENGFF